MYRSCLIVQMRLDSSRLPRKALLPLGRTCLAGHVLQRLASLPAACHILACDHASADTLAPYAHASGFRLVSGPKEDVLGRFALAMEHCPSEYLIRATGDNPFVSVRLAASLLDQAICGYYDYAAYLGMPSGMGVEVVRASALQSAAAEAEDPYEREHVCPFIYNRPERFAILRADCPPEYRLEDFRLTIDTEADYQVAGELVAELGEQPTDAAIMAWARGRRELVG